MIYPKSVKEIKNLNEFIRKAREFETDKYWSNILYDCSSANYADWTRRESRLKWKREMIQKYLDYKNNKLNEGKLIEMKQALIYEINSKLDKLKGVTDKHFKTTAQGRQRKQLEFNYNNKTIRIVNVHNDDFVIFINNKCYDKNSRIIFNNIEEILDIIKGIKLEEKASIDWNNYLTPEEVKKFLSKDDKVESAENIIYSKEFEPRYKDLHNPLQARYKNSWTRKELVQDLIEFYNSGHLITESKHKIEEKSRNELLAKTKSQTITRYNKAQEYKGFYIRGVDTDELLKKDSLLTINCQVGNYRDQVQMENMLYWVEYEIEERNHDLQVTTKYVTQALMDAIDGMNIKVNCDCGDFCLEENTRIKLLNGEVVTVKQLKEKFDNRDELWVYSTDENGDFKPGKVSNVWISGQSSEMIKITLDNGEHIITTPNHKYMMRDTTYKRAQDLSIGDSLMPLYFQYTNGYENVKRNSIVYPTRFDSVYKIVANNILLNEIENAKIRSNEDIIVIHHKDFKKLNNYPSNLYPMGKLEHWYYHAHLGGKNLDKLIEAGRRFWKEDPRRFEALEKQKNAAREYQLNMWKNFTPEEKEAYIQKSVKKMDRKKLSESHKTLWKNYTEEQKYKRLETNFFITNNPLKDPNFLNSDKMLERNKHIGESNHKYMQSLTKEERCNKYGTRKDIKESEETKLKKSISLKTYYKENPITDEKRNKLRLGGIRQAKQNKLSRCKRNIYELIEKGLVLNEENFYKNRKNGDPHWNKVFNSFEEMLTYFEIPLNYNHKIINIEQIIYENPIDVYDIEVEKYHNFYVNAGVMLHNCYRMAYQATKYGYKYGTPENRPAKIRNPNDIGALCFAKDTLVFTKDGLIPIQDIKPGMLVYTHKGRLKPVISIGNRTVDKIIEFKIGTEIVQCSEEHPFLASNDSGTNIRWEAAKNLDINFNGNILSPVLKSDNSDNQPKNYAFLLGLYLADGTLGYRADYKNKTLCSNIRISIDHKFKKFYDKLFNELNLEYNYYNTKNTNSGYYTILNNIQLRDFIAKYGGFNYKDESIKFISDEVLNWSKIDKIELVRGFFIGDGQFGTNGKYLNMNFLNTNKDLLWKLNIIIKSLGIHTRWFTYSRKPRYIAKNKKISIAKDMYHIRITGKDITLIDCELLHNLKYAKNQKYKISKYKARTINYNNTTYFLNKIKSKRIIKESFEVFNLSIDTDDSYLITREGLAVHNCKHLTSILSNKKWLQQVTSILMDFIVDNIDKVNQFLRRQPGKEFTTPNAEARALGKQSVYKKFLNRQELIQEVANEFIKESEDKLFTMNTNLDDDLQRFINDNYSVQKITAQEFKVIRELINNYIQENNKESEDENNEQI